MPRGGHAASGPAPDPNALRRARPSDQAGWKTLPAEGRTGELPEWPLTEATDREREIWTGLWAKPQAVMWGDMGQALEVALFARTLAEAERPDARVDVKKMVRGYLDSLGLSVAGMNRNRWRIAPAVEQPGDIPVADPRAAPRRPGPRDRLKVVPSGDGA